MKKLNFIPILLVGCVYMVSSPVSSQDKFGGATLYTVRDAMETQPRETIKEVADIGYKYIEAVGYKDRKFYGMEPAEFKKYLKSLGLVPLSAHQGGVTMENADEMIADVKAAGIKYFVVPVPPGDYFKFDRDNRSMTISNDLAGMVEFLNTLGRKCKDAGLELLYHNHNFEFQKNEDGIVPYKFFLENTDPKLVNFQMDLYWATKAGEDPVVWFEKYPGRFIIWHVKDMDDQGRFAPVGKGNLDLKRILDKKDVAGMKYYIVEQDMTFGGMDPLEAVRISHEGLKKYGFK